MKDFLTALKRYLKSSQPLEKKLKFIFWAILKYRWVLSMERAFQQYNLSKLLDAQAYIFYMFRMHAFMSKAQDSGGAILALAQAHFSTLSQKMSAHQIDMLYGQGISLFEEEMEGHQIALKLQYDERMRFEGQMTLKLWMDGEELYYLHCLFGEQMIYIGGIQGAKGKLEQNRVFTKITHGLRPQNFVYFGLTSLAKAWEIPQIWGIRNRYHVYQNESKSQDKVIFDFEAFWDELGGKVINDEWVGLPAIYIRKPLEEISNKKRSTYRKRYAFMDEVVDMIRTRLSDDR